MNQAALLTNDQLLTQLFGKPANSNSRKWLYRKRKARQIPFIKLGRDVFYDVEAVKAHLSKQNTVRAK